MSEKGFRWVKTAYYELNMLFCILISTYLDYKFCLKLIERPYCFHTQVIFRCKTAITTYNDRISLIIPL